MGYEAKLDDLLGFRRNLLQLQINLVLVYG